MKFAYLEFSVAITATFISRILPVPASCWPLVLTSELDHKHLVACIGKVNILDREPRWFERDVKETIYICINKITLNNYGIDTSYQMFMTQVWRHHQKVSNLTVLGQSVAVLATENSSYANFMCCDQKFTLSKKTFDCLYWLVFHSLYQKKKKKKKKRLV